MLSNSIMSILKQAWPMIMICLVILISLRLGYIIKNKIKIKIYQELVNLGFIIYFMCLFYIVTFEDVSWSGSNLIPFKELTRYDFGSKAFFKNILGNVFLFVPYGIAIGYYVGIKKIRHCLLMGLLLSSTIEATQYMIGRVFDVDDILLNVIGCVIGISLYLAFINIREKLPKFFRSEIFNNIIMILITLFIIVYLLLIFGVI